MSRLRSGTAQHSSQVVTSKSDASSFAFVFFDLLAFALAGLAVTSDALAGVLLARAGALTPLAAAFFGVALAGEAALHECSKTVMPDLGQSHCNYSNRHTRSLTFTIICRRQAGQCGAPGDFGLLDSPSTVILRLRSRVAHQDAMRCEVPSCEYM